MKAKPGVILRVELAGRGCVGDPKKSDRQKVKDDIEDGYISEEHAKIVYG